MINQISACKLRAYHIEYVDIQWRRHPKSNPEYEDRRRMSDEVGECEKQYRVNATKLLIYHF